MNPLLLIAAAFLALVATLRGLTRRAPRVYRLANIAEGVHRDGLLTKFADVAFPTRYLICKIGSGQQNITLAGPTDVPFGVVQDSTDTGGVTDLTIPLLVNVLGGTGFTGKVAINSTVNQGDMLVLDTGGYARSKPTTLLGVSYAIGRALRSGVAGDVIEFAPDVPSAGSQYVPVYAAIASATVASVNDVLPIAGLLATDIVIVSLIAQGGAENLVKAAPAAGQINVTLTAAATIGTTKYGVAVFRVINT